MPAVLLATDADWIFDEVDAALASDERAVYRVRRGSTCCRAVAEVEPDLVDPRPADRQHGRHGHLHGDPPRGGPDRLPITAVLMLLDRAADIFLAHRADADGWLIKPLDAFRLRKAATALFDGGQYTEGVPDDAGEPLRL